MAKSSAPTTSWRDVLKIHPAAEMFPIMPPDELKLLGEDIKKHGLHSPVYLQHDKKGEGLVLLDGRNRLDAMEAAGLPVLSKDSSYLSFDLPHEFLEKIDPYEFVLSANIHRRHLTVEQKRELIAKLLKAAPTKSDRQIAETVKASPTTVGAVRRELEPSTVQSAQLPPAKRIGKDGKTRTAPRKKRRDVDDNLAEKKQRLAEKAERREKREAELASKITALPAQKYGVIYADPPWRFETYSRETGMDRAADNHYPTMTTDEIAALDIASIAAPDCVLFLWGTVPMLLDALKVMKDWGFDYKSQAVWIKDRFGHGYWFWNRHELLLVGGEISRRRRRGCNGTR